MAAIRAGVSARAAMSCHMHRGMPMWWPACIVAQSIHSFGCKRARLQSLLSVIGKRPCCSTHLA
eukprot:14909715-Alexandrium_andersonii.AAC.1